MIEKIFEDSFSDKWVRQNITDPTNEFVILRRIIPWQKIIDELTPFYNQKAGPKGLSLRIIIAIFIVAKLRLLGDRPVIKQVQENRYIQYFCNVKDKDLMTFMHNSSLSRIRKRLGIEGISIIESNIFNDLYLADIIEIDSMLIDSTVLSNNIIYPTDIQLIFKGFEKMKQFAKHHGIPLWWDDKEIKEMWRAYNLNKNKGKILDYLFDFAEEFLDALLILKEKVQNLKTSDSKKEKAEALLALLLLLEEQTEEKLRGNKYIKNRIVSLDEPDARPIKKGKKHPDCEFGTTLQLSFNRQGFMVTVENFIGKPNDTTLWPATAKLFMERMDCVPDFAIGDQGYRSKINLKIPSKTEHIFLGKSSDVPEEEKDYCRKARSATEGFIAVAKNLRGFGRSLYRGFEGDKIWSSLCQTAYNLKKFLQLYYKEKLTEDSLIKIGLLT